MKIEIEHFNSGWKQAFEHLNSELSEILKPYQIRIDHIGSTSVENLSAKPIIDILIGIKNEDELDEIADVMVGNHFIYYKIFNPTMPYRRFFIRSNQKTDDALIISNEKDLNSKILNHADRVCHVHIIPEHSVHWLRHIAFKEYLHTHDKVRNEYQDLKNSLSKLEWKDENEYNAAKNDFIKHHEKLALAWYKNNAR